MDRKRCLICMDLDGTLLLPGGILSPFAEGVLRKLESQGHLVVLCSGRPLRSILPYYKQAGLKSPIIADNGASLYFQDGKEYRYPAKMVEEVYERTLGYVFSFMAESDRQIYVDTPDPILGRYFPFEGMETIRVQNKEDIQEECHTLLFGVKEGTGDKLKGIAKDYPGIGYRAWRGISYGEFYFLDGQKGDRLKEIQTRNHIESADIYAFGDSDNDEGMLLCAGHPFAMKNAKSDRLKENFPLTEKSNAEDGVAYELVKAFGL